MRRDGDRILVIRPDNIGDVVLTSPLFRALRRHRPTATIGLLASPGGAAAAPLLPWIDEVIEARTVWQDLGARLPLDPAREQGLIDRLRRGHWDVALIATSWRQTAWPAGYLAYLAGIPVRVGFASDFGGSVLSHVLPLPPEGTHAVERNLALLAALGIDPEDDHLEISIPTHARAAVTRRLRDAGVTRDYVLAVPGASAPARRPDAARMAESAAETAEALAIPVVVAGTERERDLIGAFRAAVPRSVHLGLDLTVPEFAALIDGASVVLCANSAALHLADAVGTPVVAAYAGTDLRSQWRPRHTASALRSLPVGCSPCYRITCPIENACLDITPEAMAAAALDVVRGGGREPTSGRRLERSAARERRSGRVRCAA